MIISGGTDGKVCIWQWGRDEFLHRAGELYITNLPIQSAKVMLDNFVSYVTHEFDTSFLILNLFKCKVK